MPAKSKAQANLMRAAAHGADFPMAKKVRASMSKESLTHYTHTKSADLPTHVRGNRYHPSRHGK